MWLPSLLGLLERSVLAGVADLEYVTARVARVTRRGGTDSPYCATCAVM